MDFVRREQLVSIICSKYTPGAINGTSLLFGSPTPYQKMVSNQIYEDWYTKGLQSGLLDEEESLDLAKSRNIWNIDLEIIFDDLKSDIDKLKIGLFECAFRSSEKRAIQKNLRSAKNKYRNLASRKSSLDSNTAEFVAQMIKGLYLSCCEIYLPNKQLFLDPEEVLNTNNMHLNQILDHRQKYLLPETTLRVLARSEPWRSLWTISHESSELFDCRPVELNTIQQSLMVWSKVYDNVHESMDCPADEVIDEDDALDGWFILQKRKREKDLNQKQIDSLTGNSKINQSDEVFIQADTPEDAQKIYGMNDPVARGKLLKRQRLIDAKGRVKEAELPDSKLKIKMAAQQQYAAQVKNKG